MTKMYHSSLEIIILNPEEKTAPGHTDPSSSKPREHHLLSNDLNARDRGCGQTTSLSATLEWKLLTRNTSESKSPPLLLLTLTERPWSKPQEHRKRRKNNKKKDVLVTFLLDSGQFSYRSLHTSHTSVRYFLTVKINQT